MRENESRTLYGQSVFTDRTVRITVADGRISTVSEVEDSDSHSYDFVSPGFFDIQVNGYYGSDYSLDGFGEDDLRAIHRYLAQAGTTQHMPTIVTSPQNRMLRNLEIMANAYDHDDLLASAVPGIHIEGPYLSAEDGPRGAHDPSYIRNPDYAEFAEWQAASGNRIRLVTLAPERPGAIEFIERVRTEGVQIAIGHTAATAETIARAVRAGASLSTHLGNGSHANIPRLVNYIWEQLACDDLWASIISDGFHLPPPVVKVFARAKGLPRLILVSDAALFGGYRPGIHKWGNVEVEVFPDGHLGIPGTSILAGAAHLLDWEIPHFHRYSGASLGDAIRLCTENPSRFTGLDGLTTSLRVGEPANLTFFRYSPGQDRLSIVRSFCFGKEVYTKTEDAQEVK